MKSQSVLGFNSSEGITNFNNHDISYIPMRCELCIKHLWDEISRKNDLLKELHLLVKALNKNYKFPSEDKCGVEGKYGVFKNIITKLTDYFFTIIESGNTSFENDPLITQQKEIFRLIKCFWSHVH